MYGLGLEALNSFLVRVELKKRSKAPIVVFWERV